MRCQVDVKGPNRSLQRTGTANRSGSLIKRMKLYCLWGTNRKRGPVKDWKAGGENIGGAAEAIGVSVAVNFPQAWRWHRGERRY